MKQHFGEAAQPHRDATPNLCFSRLTALQSAGAHTTLGIPGPTKSYRSYSRGVCKPGEDGQEEAWPSRCRGHPRAPVVLLLSVPRCRAMRFWLTRVRVQASATSKT